MGGASSEAARILARSENLADVVGGVPNGEGSDETDPIILNMFQTHAINQSRTFGAGLLRNLGTVNRLKFTSVQEAPFIVLKLPEIPSVLVETAYISNPKEEKLLMTDGFQIRVAETVARSICDFLPPLPPVVTAAVATKEEKPVVPESVKDSAAAEGRDAAGAAEQPASAQKAPAAPVKINSPVIFRGKTSEYRVKAGDTLYRIAREHGTSVELLMSLNRIDPGEPLAVGNTLRVPGRSSVGTDSRGPGHKDKGKATAAAKGKHVIHRVKKGETIAAIARKYGTTVRQIEALNRLKPSDPLYVDRKLIVPGHPSL